MDNITFFNQLLKEHECTGSCASAKEVSEWYKAVLSFIFPGFSDVRYKNIDEVELEFNVLKTNLQGLLLCNKHLDKNQVVEVSENFFESLPTIKEHLDKDAEAIFKGDPAAKSILEVTRSYPGFYAIAAHRIAKKLNALGIELIPRMISEHAHSITGIDIHPNASIGAYFFIDHGTGVVIGETSVIGNWVKIYQGVTLGALSVDKSDQNTKRHPTVEDEAIIYAGATILGGETTIGKGSVIGGNVWLTKSVPPHSKVYYQAKMSNESGEIDTITFKS